MQDRILRYADASATLALLGDHRLARLVDGATPLGTGIGGTTALLDVGGVPVFVKRAPLTDRELRPENLRSTANMFDLPPRCQYGVGGPGFGAWRELAANTLTTNQVLTGRAGSYPLLYHWRVLPGAAPVAEEHADPEAAVAYWGGSAAVRDRLDALARASHSLVLFLEYVPWNLGEWLRAQLDAGGDAVGAACALLERDLLPGTAAMGAHGVAHFDAHFRNVLTDGHRLYFADLGLATSLRFDLSPAEREFVAHNATHDDGYARMLLVNWLVTHVCGLDLADTADRNAHVRRYAEGVAPAGAPEGVAATVVRYAPVAAAMNAFYWDLFGTSRATPYPAAEVGRALARERAT
ncbi:serine/threonine protein phosphatase [Longispora sp. NPDC051575]|uniref:serine/threonine protein phosphatase n=1 Tax=Longispora sp. NPDC051575 TaxID=3154943 RepID=UPI00343FF0EB